MLFDASADEVRRRDFATICRARPLCRGQDALLAAADAANRAGICDAYGDVLLGDALISALAAAPLTAEWIVGARQLLTLSYPGTVAREPALVALWDAGPECAIVANHSGDGDPEVIGHVPWARSALHERDGRCGRLDDGETAVGRAQLKYERERIPGAQGEAQFRADLESDFWDSRVASKWL